MSSKNKGLLGRYDLFIFDWDGTLSSMRVLLRANESLKRALHIWNKDSSIKDLSTMNHDLKERIRGEERRNDILTFLFDVFLNFSRPKLHNDSVKMLKIMRGRGKKTAVFSNSGGRRLATEIHYLGISKYFDAVVSAKELKAVKPNPTGIRLILKRLKVSPGRCLYIGDMTDDVIAAKLAHVHSCAVSNGFDSYHRLRSARPDHIFRSIEEMAKAL